MATKSTFDELQFVGWDGEGINPCTCKTNPDCAHTEWPCACKIIRGDDCKCGGWIDNWTERQLYSLIAVSTGETLWDVNGISFEARLNFICDVAQKHPRAIHCFFGGSYDFNKILEGLPRHKVDELHTSRHFVHYRGFVFRYRPRKELVIGRIKDGAAAYQPYQAVRSQCDAYIRLWDVVGFFQDNFINVVRKWLGTDYVDYELIAQGKRARLHFSGNDREFMIAYNAAEVRALVCIMDKFKAQLSKLGLRIIRWDGAGALAGQMFKEYRLIQAFSRQVGRRWEKIVLEPSIIEAARYGYRGGRIEAGYIGREEGEIYNYDINSAYPFGASQLPDLNAGEWVHHEREIWTYDALKMSKFTLFRVQWFFHNERMYYPFAFRTQSNSVIFPQYGEAWVFAPEVRAAIHALKPGDYLSIREAWEFQYKDHDSPFEILASIYKQRQALVAAKDPAEYPLKLGINSVYGKLCQKLGWNEKTGESPRFHFLPFAGWITSFTRAAIYSAIQDNLDDVIAINTDGIVTRGPLPGIQHSPDKAFGAWSVEKNREIVQLQSGVYWIKDEKGVWKERARGLGRVAGDGDSEEERNASRQEKIESRIGQVMEGWANPKVEHVYFPVKRFITSQMARTSDSFFPRWGHWHTMHDEEIEGRALQIRCGVTGKRELMKSTRTITGMIPTRPQVNFTWEGEIGNDNPEIRDLGMPYELPWMDGKPDAPLTDADILELE